MPVDAPAHRSPLVMLSREAVILEVAGYPPWLAERVERIGIADGGRFARIYLRRVTS
jgi:hypothetical protein